MTKYHLIPTFHHDIAYLRPESWYTETATRILDRAAAMMEEDASFTYTVEQAYFFDEYWREHPEKQDSLRRLVQNGQLHFAPGFWSVPDMSMPSGESLFMQAYYGKKLLRETVGYEPKTAFIADCWGHNAALPMIMRQCGYDGYTFSRCMEKTFDIENYRWRGLDGTEIPTHWMSTAYAGLSFPDRSPAVNAEELHWEDATVDGVRRLAERNRTHCGEDNQILPVGGDMRMPSLAAPALVREMQKREELAGMRFSCFEDAFSDIDFSDKPVYEGEFISSLKGTFATNIKIKQNNRRLESELYALETLSVLQNHPVELEDIWKTALKNQFHDILCGSICDEALVQVMGEYRDALAKCGELRDALAGDGEKRRVNLLNFPISGILSDDGTDIAYHADGFSPLEEKELQPEKISLPAEYENEFYIAKIDARGYITSLIDKKSGKTLVDNPSIPFGSLQMQADSGDNWVEFEYPWEEDATLYTTNVPDPYDRRKLPTHPKVQLSANGVDRAFCWDLGGEGLVIRQEGHLRYWITDVPFTITVTFAKSSPRIEYKTAFRNETKRIRIRAAFPLANPSDKIRYQIPYGIVERSERTQPAERFIDCGGLALFNKGLPQNNVEDGILLLTLFRSVAMEYKCRSELSYNVGENFCCEYAIVPHGMDADDLLWREALAFHMPIPETDAGFDGWKIENAYISAMRFVDGDVFLRLYSGTAESKTAVITIPDGFTKAAVTDGLMQPGEWFAVNGQFSLQIAPWSVVGVRLSRR